MIQTNCLSKVIISFYGSIISKLNSQYYKILDFIYPAISVILYWISINKRIMLWLKLM